MTVRSLDQAASDRPLVVVSQKTLTRRAILSTIPAGRTQPSVQNQLSEL